MREDGDDKYIYVSIRRSNRHNPADHMGLLCDRGQGEQKGRGGDA